MYNNFLSAFSSSLEQVVMIPDKTLAIKEICDFETTLFASFKMVFDFVQSFVFRFW
jgi:hypothetical protein